MRIIKADVAVFGSGPAGVGAALAAARTGAKTILVEKMSFIGGQMTAGQVTGLHGFRTHAHGMRNGAYLCVDHETKQTVKGIAEEIITRLKERNAAYLEKDGPSMRVEFDDEELKVILFEMMKAAGVHLMLNSFAFGTVMDGGKITGVRIANKNGEELIVADQYVDSTADGDIAAWSFAPFETGRKEDGRCMPISLFVRIGGVDFQKILNYLKENPQELHNGTVDGWQKLYDRGAPVDLSGFRSLIQKAFHNGDFPIPIGAVYDFPYPIFFVSRSYLPEGQIKILTDMAYGIDCSDADQLNKAELFTRMIQAPAIVNFVKKYIPGFENSYLISTAPLIGTRDSRRIMGEYVLNEDDIISNRKFPDVIARCGRAMNVHSVTGGQLHEERGGQVWVESKEPQGYDIPLRCLIPQKVENLFISGRCISVTHMALGSTRGMPVCMATGEAAGTAAALCSTNKTTPRTIDISKLQNVLRSHNVLID